MTPAAVAAPLAVSRMVGTSTFDLTHDAE